MLVGIIGDEDTVTGMLLTGIGERNTKGETNFFIIDASNFHLNLNKLNNFKNLVFIFRNPA